MLAPILSETQRGVPRTNGTSCVELQTAGKALGLYYVHKGSFKEYRSDKRK